MHSYSIEPDQVTEVILGLPFTYEVLHSPENEKMSSYDKDLMGDLYFEAMEGSSYAIRQLKKLIRKYPRVATLKNHLCAAYKMSGKKIKADQIAALILKEHPNYLFGNLTHASMMMDQDRPDEVPKILGETLSLRDFRPETDLFHISEIKAYYSLVGHFHLECGRIELASAICDALEEITNEDDNDVLQLRLSVGEKNVDRMLKTIEQDKPHRIDVTVPPDILADVTSEEAPEFTHQQIEDLYKYGLGISPERISQIISLPRASLVRDLEHVLRDAIERGALYVWDEVNFQDEETFFPMHAIFLLGELKATESLPLVLQLLSKHPDTLDFWFGVVYLESLWEPLYHLVEGQIDNTREWMVAPGIAASSKVLLAYAITRIVFHQPEKRGEVLEWYRSILDFLLHSPVDDNILDTGLVTDLVWNLMCIQGKELLPLVKELYEKRYTARAAIGEWEDIEVALNEAHHAKGVDPQLGMIERYRRLNTPRPSKVPDNVVPLRDSILEDYSEPHERLGFADESSPEVGRNDPCPCGSGKKYKKCHLR